MSQKIVTRVCNYDETFPDTVLVCVDVDDFYPLIQKMLHNSSHTANVSSKVCVAGSRASAERLRHIGLGSGGGFDNNQQVISLKSKVLLRVLQ